MKPNPDSRRNGNFGSRMECGMSLRDVKSIQLPDEKGIKACGNPDIRLGKQIFPDAEMVKLETAVNRQRQKEKSPNEIMETQIRKEGFEGK